MTAHTWPFACASRVQRSGMSTGHSGPSDDGPRFPPARLPALKTTPTPALKQQWRELFGSEPPFNCRYLESRLAYRIEELRRSGLKPETIRQLEPLAEELAGGDRTKLSIRADRQRPIAGMRLLREWQGVAHVVTVTADGFEWQGRPYKPLSAIARATTGTC